ncbi:hypothetical protein C8A00DRAFT_41724 [Chaetomidium leptoderma]|uniref:General negative regulator of transcription subunit 4 n=1 Tax=Chaetomidium leptoderma TaxID=669021 RepID=A0AAN7A0G3_9PEZI|nr:hypothetical protein C8A00DRAFT_41724 [Chaetomidium leptoderma]
MAPQDTYIDDDEDCCPLCIEELDLSDRNFRPCPCGYQICQFCFNNIRTNMNGLCPACRRPYDDKTIQWKVVTQEEIAEFRANIQKNQKKRAADQRHKEAQKREAEKENRKNLVGVRVVQKNLVYVTGLTPTVHEDELLKTLRKPEFFGQYGNILKISISSRKGTDGLNQSLGVYVTFEKQDDAGRCIQAVNGSQNGDRVLRAQLGTTKYCSAWLRHEQCTNRQCMFLHELGDEEDSYSRQDLSSMNSINSQRPNQNAGSSRSASRQQAHPSPSPAVAHPMARSSSRDGSDNGDTPALPASANWARNPQVRSRRGSHATSAAAPSPAISNSLPVTAESAVEDAPELPVAAPPARASPARASPARASPVAAHPRTPSTVVEIARRIPQDALKSLLKSLEGCSLAWPKPGGDLPHDEFNTLYPPLFDIRGGMRRRALRASEDNSSVEDQQSAGGVREPSEGEPESSGSLALGGEPEDRDLGREGPAFDQRRVAQPPIHRGSADGLFGQAVGSGFTQTAANLGSIGSRTMTPQQPAFMRPPVNLDNLSAQANLFQGQGQGHNRQGSRFSFANDGREAASATSVKLAANPRIMAQQSSMMPSSFHNQPGGQYYASSMPGPPPGLKSTGTPPGVFGQHGFGSAAFGGASKDTNEMLQLFRGRGASSQAHDAGKLDLADPSILQARMQSQQHLQQQSNAGLGQGLFGGQSQDDDLPILDEVRSSIEALVADEPIDINIRQPPGAFESLIRSVTPSVPPGFSFASAHPSPAISHSSLPTTSMGRQTPPVALPKGPIKPPVAASSPLTRRAITPSVPEAKKAVKALAAESGLSKDIAKAKSQKLLQDEDFPALNSAKPQRAATPVSQPKASASKAGASNSKKSPETHADKVKEKAKEKEKGKEKEKEKEKPAPAPAPAPTPEQSEPPKPETKSPEKAAEKKADKRPVPGLLNIAAATKAAQIKNVDAQSASTDRDSAFPALPFSTSVSVSSPLARAAPKTLRVVSTPKTEAPSTPILTTPIRVHHLGLHFGIGSAPVRATTKSQQRKQRKEASKKETATIAAQPVKVETAVEIGPILGRKKKQRKEKEKPGSKTATPAVSRPGTPLPTHPTSVKETREAAEVKEAKEESSAYRSTANETTTLTDEPPLHKGRYGSDPSTPRTLPTPASVLYDLQTTGLVSDNLESLSFFKSVSVQLDKSRSDANNTGLRDQAAKNSMTPTKSIVTEDDQASLLAGKPVRKVMDGARILLTPNGDCIRNLGAEEEDRFLELQQLVAEVTASPAAFVSSRHEAGGGFSLIKGRAVPNGPPSYFPAGPGAYPSDPVNKIQREEAIYYINQDMSLPKAMSTWTTDPRGSAAQAAAANLSSVAPWLYGGIGSPSGSHLPPMSHDDMLDAGAAPPELSYPGPVGAFADDLHHVGAHGNYVDINAQLPTVEEVFGTGPASTTRHHHHHHHHHHPHHHNNQQTQPQQPSASASASASSSAIAAAAGGGGGGINFASPGPFGNVPLMSLEDAEQALSAARKETEKLEKNLNQLMRKNRRLLHDAVAAVAMAVALARVLRGLSSMGEAAFAAVWMAVLLIESVVSMAARGAVVAVEVVCAVLDWVGAEY